jgi:hypothetical protein
MADDGETRGAPIRDRRRANSQGGGRKGRCGGSPDKAFLIEKLLVEWLQTGGDLKK